MRTELVVEGMTCNGCATSVRRALERVEGVERAEVRLREGRAEVDADGVEPEELVRAVEAAGFLASINVGT